jgi:hypothetical protein
MLVNYWKNVDIPVGYATDELRTTKIVETNASGLQR